MSEVWPKSAVPGEPKFRRLGKVLEVIGVLVILIVVPALCAQRPPALPLFAFFVLLAALFVHCNISCLMFNRKRDRKASHVIGVAGYAAMCAILSFPLADIRIWAWIPIVLDPGIFLVGYLSRRRLT